VPRSPLAHVQEIPRATQHITLPADATPPAVEVRQSGGDSHQASRQMVTGDFGPQCDKRHGMPARVSTAELHHLKRHHPEGRLLATPDGVRFICRGVEYVLSDDVWRYGQRGVYSVPTCSLLNRIRRAAGRDSQSRSEAR
jgi:hypothetical protein